MQLIRYAPENNLEWTIQFNTRKKNTGVNITTLFDLMISLNGGPRYFTVVASPVLRRNPLNTSLPGSGIGTWNTRKSLSPRS